MKGIFRVRENKPSYVPELGKEFFPVFEFVPAEGDVVAGCSPCCCPLPQGVCSDFLDSLICFYIISIGFVHHPPVGALHHAVDEKGLVGRCSEQCETSNKEIVIPCSNDIQPVGLKVGWKKLLE